MDLISRRKFLARSAGVATLAAASIVAGPMPTFSAPLAESGENSAQTGRLKQSVCRWPYAKVSLPDFCRRTQQMGFAAVDLLFPEEWTIAADAGLTVSMGYA